MMNSKISFKKDLWITKSATKATPYAPFSSHPKKANGMSDPKKTSEPNAAVSKFNPFFCPQRNKIAKKKKTTEKKLNCRTPKKSKNNMLTTTFTNLYISLKITKKIK